MLNHQTRTFSRANTPMGIFVNVAPLPVRRQQAINIANVSSAKSGWSLCNKLARKSNTKLSRHALTMTIQRNALKFSISRRRISQRYTGIFCHPCYPVTFCDGRKEAEKSSSPFLLCHLP